MRTRISRITSSMCVMGLTIAALVLLALSGGGAEASKSSPSPTPAPVTTDVGVAVVKEEQITTQVDVASTHAMAIAVSNNGNPADVRLTLLAVSKLGICEARLVPVVSDYYIEIQTDEDNNGVPET